MLLRLHRYCSHWGAPPLPLFLCPSTQPFCLQINPRRGIFASEKWIPVRAFREKHKNGDLFKKSSGSPRTPIVQDHNLVTKLVQPTSFAWWCLWAFDEGGCCRFQMTKGQCLRYSVYTLKGLAWPVVCACLGWVCSWPVMHWTWKGKAPGIKSSFWSLSKHRRQNFVGLSG